MNRKVGCRVWVVFLSVVLIASCKPGQSTDGAAPHAPSVNIEGLDEERMDLVDHYLSIDQRAFVGVSKSDAERALAGDGAMAFAIANEFGSSNYLSEARFWFQISAENGDARGMSYYATYLEPLSCHRANYWQRRALEAGLAGSGERHDQLLRLLSKKESECTSET